MTKTYAVDEDVAEAIRRRFTYHPPVGDQPKRFALLRCAAKDLAAKIVEHTPPSREQSLALTKLDEVVMHANSAIARNETAEDQVAEDSPGENPEDSESAAGG